MNVFVELLNNSYFDNVSVDVEQTDQLIRLLDTVVIKLEGGTDEDLKVLDEQPEPPPSIDNGRRLIVKFYKCNFLNNSNLIYIFIIR